MRELGQCVRNITIRNSYHPVSPTSNHDTHAISDYTSDDRFDAFVQSVLAGELTLAELCEHIASLVYARMGRNEMASRAFGIDWRTLKANLNQGLVKKYKR